MRLLGWMHNRLRHTCIEPFKDFTIGNYCACLSAATTPDEKAGHARPRLDFSYQKCEYTPSEVKANGVNGNDEDETSAAMSELFHGFLAIGTLGSKPINSEPGTPTFPVSFENIADEKIQVTESELKLINDELEKFIEAEAEEEGCNESLARSSYASNITLSGMQMEGANADENGKAALCPLQGYLFGSSIELPEVGVELKKERASLGEMFRRTKIMEEISSEVEGKQDVQAKGTNKPAKNIIKKILRKFYASSKNPIPSTSNNAVNSISTKKKFDKVLKMFHRKVHPENPAAEKEFSELHNEKIKNNLNQDEDNRKFVQGFKSMDGMQFYNYNLNLSQYGLSGRNSSGNREYWIKTDADYLVLEL